MIQAIEFIEELKIIVNIINQDKNMHKCVILL
jgi:hypothetical protein